MEKQYYWRGRIVAPNIVKKPRKKLPHPVDSFIISAAFLSLYKLHPPKYRMHGNIIVGPIEKLRFNPKTKEIKIFCKNGSYFSYYPFQTLEDIKVYRHEKRTKRPRTVKAET